MNEFREVFETGVERRKVGPTGLNDVSSRSHAVLAIAVTNGVSKGKLNLIDLAGSLLLQTPVFFFFFDISLLLQDAYCFTNACASQVMKTTGEVAMMVFAFKRA